jgi:hypothetical protein
MKITPNLFPFSGDRTRADKRPQVAAANLSPIDIELTRSDLMKRSDAIRRGVDFAPKRTARRLANMALVFANSEAPAFERSATLVQTYGNLLAGDIRTSHTRNVGRLAYDALFHAYPENTPDHFTRSLNDATRNTYRRAAQITAPDKPFPCALEEAWEEQDLPIDPIIQATEEKILASYIQRQKERKLFIINETTGAFATPDFDD